MKQLGLGLNLSKKTRKREFLEKMERAGVRACGRVGVWCREAC